MDTSGENSQKRGRARRRFRVRWMVPLALFFALGIFLFWVGPGGVLRWAVRTWDPALSLTMEEVTLRSGNLVLHQVELHFAGRTEPIFRGKEIALGIGSRWRHGQLRNLDLESPALSLDKAVLDYFRERSSANSSWKWEFDQVKIRNGHVWLEGFGQPARDISVNVDGQLERVGPAALPEVHRLDLSGIYLAVYQGESAIPLFGAGLAEASFTLGGLIDRHLAALRVDQGWLLAGAGLQALSGSSPGESSEAGPAFVIDSLDLVDLEVHTGKVAAGLPEISLHLNSALRHVALGQAANELAQRVHQIEFSDVEILSPRDPLQRAVAVRTVFLKFSFAGLARQEIDELILLSPTIYVGQTLFEYMATADDDSPTPPQVVGATAGWRINQLRVNFGKLIIALAGRSQVGLPLAFQTTAQNVSLSSLAGLSLDLILTVPSEDYDFPAYELFFRNVRGDLRLNFPPKDDEKNLVNVVQVEGGRWRNFRAKDLWISVTFDLEGINGQFGGSAYSGYVSGGFSFFLQPEAPWTGWISGVEIDMDSLTQAVAPQNFVMSGTADMKLELNGRGPLVDRLLGSAESSKGGRVIVTKLNDIIDAIPSRWMSIRQELTRVSLETVRDFSYTNADADFWFVGDQGLLEMKMKGLSGSRNFKVVLHGEEPDRRWSQEEYLP